MKKLLICSIDNEEYGEIDIFLDEDLKILNINMQNDANWRHEYFNSVFLKIGVEIIKAQYSDIENIDQKLFDWFGF